MNNSTEKLDVRLVGFSSNSLENREQLCQLAASFREETKIAWMVILQAIVSSLTLVLMWLLLKNREMQRIYSIITLDLKVSVFVCFETRILQEMLFDLKCLKSKNSKLW